MVSFRKLRSALSVPVEQPKTDAATPGTRKPMVVRLLVRTGVLVIDYLVLGVLGFVVIPVLGEFMYSISTVASDQRATLSQQLTYWLVPFIALTLILVVGVLVLLRGLWRAGSRWLSVEPDNKLTQNQLAADEGVLPARTFAPTSGLSSGSGRSAGSGRRRTPHQPKSNGKKVATS